MASPLPPPQVYGPPELLDHGNRQAEFFGLIIGFTALACVFVMARMYTRAVLVRSVGPDDWAIFVGMLCLIASAIASVLYMKLASIGYHVWDIPLDPVQWANGQKVALAGQLLYNCVLSFSKVSILLFYRRLTPNKAFHVFIWVTMAFTIALAVAAFFADLFQCTPIAYFWDRSIPGGFCINQAAFYFAAAGFAVLADVWILALPMPVFWGLQISLKRRLILMSLFAVGFVVVIVSAFRLNTLHRVIFRTKDPTYDDTFVWSSMELCVSVICCSIPALRPLFSKLFPQVFGSIGLSNHKFSGPGYIAEISCGRRPKNGSRGARNSYDLEEMGGKGSSKVYGTKRRGSISNDSEEMIIEKQAADLEHVPPYTRDQVFDGGNGKVAVVISAVR